MPRNHPLRPSPRRSGIRGISLRVAAAGIALTACTGAPAASLGDSPASARANTSDLFHALSLRFGPLTRSTRLAEIRPRYVRGSLTPSRVFDDRDVWTEIEGRSRTLAIAGFPAGDGRYMLDVRADAARPARAGDSRHIMRLTSLGNGAYEWRSLDELAVGNASAVAIDEMRRRFLAAAERRSAATLRDGWRAALPRTSAALGRLFDIHTLVSTPLADGSTSLRLMISVHPRRLRGEFPGFAAWLEKYNGPARYDVVLDDYLGNPYLLLRAEDDLVHVRARLHGGVLQPLAGALPASPADSLRLVASFSARAMLFTVGADAIVADIIPVRAAAERGWVVRFDDEPEWRLPLAVDHLMRGALRRPFTGEGLWMRLTARDSSGMPTTLGRDFRMEVKESAIVRWIGALGNSAMSDVTTRVEHEKDRFIADVYRALGADLAAQMAAGGAGS